MEACWTAAFSDFQPELETSHGVPWWLSLGDPLLDRNSKYSGVSTQASSPALKPQLS